jgi:hypothetical protein
MKHSYGKSQKQYFRKEHSHPKHLTVLEVSAIFDIVCQAGDQLSHLI